MSPCRPCRSNGKGQDLPVFFVPEPLARPDACSRADPSFPVSPVVLLRCFGDGRSIGVCGRNVIPSSKKNRRLWWSQGKKGVGGITVRSFVRPADLTVLRSCLQTHQLCIGNTMVGTGDGREGSSIIADRARRVRAEMSCLLSGHRSQIQNSYSRPRLARTWEIGKKARVERWIKLCANRQCEC
jgi:hypothetical protein